MSQAFNDFPNPRVSFEKAKVWSDYLGFYLRTIACFTVGSLCVNRLTKYNTLADIDIVQMMMGLGLLVSGLIFFAFGICMLIKTNNFVFDRLGALWPARGPVSFVFLAFTLMVTLLVTSMLTAAILDIAIGGGVR